MTGGRLAFALGAVLLAGLALNLVLVRRDAARLDELEVVGQPSAVGDTRFFEPPEDLQKGQTVTTHRGQPLAADDKRPRDHHDGMMMRAASDDRGFVLYRSIREKDGQPLYPDLFFLKTGEHEYLALRPAP